MRTILLIMILFLTACTLQNTIKFTPHDIESVDVGNAGIESAPIKTVLEPKHMPFCNNCRTRGLAISNDWTYLAAENRIMRYNLKDGSIQQFLSPEKFTEVNSRLKDPYDWHYDGYFKGRNVTGGDIEINAVAIQHSTGTLYFYDEVSANFYRIEGLKMKVIFPGSVLITYNSLARDIEGFTMVSEIYDFAVDSRGSLYVIDYMDFENMKNISSFSNLMTIDVKNPKDPIKEFEPSVFTTHLKTNKFLFTAIEIDRQDFIYVYDELSNSVLKLDIPKRQLLTLIKMKDLLPENSSTRYYVHDLYVDDNDDLWLLVQRFNPLSLEIFTKSSPLNQSEERYFDYKDSYDRHRFSKISKTARTKDFILIKIDKERRKEFWQIPSLERQVSLSQFSLTGPDNFLAFDDERSELIRAKLEPIELANS